MSTNLNYIRYHNTNCYFIENRKNEILAIDAGWPNTLYEYARKMKEIRLKMNQIKWAIVTHFHMDHAGLISEFIENGINCIVFENQIKTIGEMEKTIRKNYPTYKLIDQMKLLYWETINVKRKLVEIGINGNVVITNGHSKDSISYITENKEAIIGDLVPIEYVMEEDSKSMESYNLLRSNNVEICLPAHAPAFKLVE
jgi:ribonuclease/clavin/mitogillin